ncbi:MAG: response regulator [Planctomycetota bacterium]
MATLLIVDDSQFQRKMLRSVALGMGHEVLEATDGQQGLALAEERRPDCMICDLVMPVLGGLEVLAALKESKNPTPVIIVTSDIQEPVRRQCRELGAVAFICKPAPPDQLRQAIQAALETRKNAHEHS